MAAPPPSIRLEKQWERKMSFSSIAVLFRVSLAGHLYQILDEGSLLKFVPHTQPAAMTQNGKEGYLLYNFIWKNKYSGIGKGFFFVWQPNILTDPLWKMKKCPMLPKSYKINWTIWAHWGVEGTARECWHSSSGPESFSGRVYFLLGCSLIRILCNTWDSPRTLNNYLFLGDSYTSPVPTPLHHHPQAWGLYFMEWEALPGCHMKLNEMFVWG